MLKRPLQAYDDLSLPSSDEEGELWEGGKEDDKLSPCSDYEDEDSFQSAALPVAKLPVGKDLTLLTGLTGEEYLALVQRERRQLPGLVFVQDARCKEAGGKETRCKEVESAVFPGKDCMPIFGSWCHEYWESFCDSKQALEAQLVNAVMEELNLPALRNCDSWLKLLYGDEATLLQPNLGVLGRLRADERLVLALLEHHGHWIRTLAISLENERVSTWLVALLMCLDGRCLQARDVAILRDLGRVLINGCHGTHSMAILTIISRGFGQHDLVKIV
jgi:hypothetical protein